MILLSVFVTSSLRADQDNDVDFADVDCAVLGECAPPPPPPPLEDSARLCRNGIDDDEDGRVDCLDEGCAQLVQCLETHDTRIAGRPGALPPVRYETASPIEEEDTSDEEAREAPRRDEWDLDLTATINVPHSIGLEANLRTPLAITGQLAIGYAPAAFFDAMLSVLDSEGSVSGQYPIFADLLPQLVAPGAWLVRVGIGVALPAGGELIVGYSGMFMQTHLSAVTLGRFVNPTWDAGGSTDVFAELSLHAFHARLAWRFLLTDQLVLRVGLGWVHVLDAALRHDIEQVFGNSGDVAARTRIVEVLVEWPLEAYGFTPEATIALGHRF